ncbi:carbon-nitrogen hydrolase family protein [Paraburkholderia sp. BCC1885]|uniref:carbon-nitrogen hydrolase family protein n=1 Tax=Paraburkholderia sp. BCC1885 TaxID=2562669 RepID=UPI0021B4B8E8|nr:carbon-nitrogen hydrolase family protein [Paraburkholderia sp. BCC1885]
MTNEMPFGPWLAESPEFEEDSAKRSAELHEEALDALASLQAGAVISSRPAILGNRLVNEAFVLENGEYRYIHHKKYFPQEAGFFEETWFVRGRDGFECHQIGPVKVGVLLCTELFFNEYARRYGRDGADVIVTPRAAGTSTQHWKTAGAMAATVSGAYFTSANRRGASASGQEFGGVGFAISPDGRPLHQTSDDDPLVIATIDLAETRQRKLEYPCYVRE